MFSAFAPPPPLSDFFCLFFFCGPAGRGRIAEEEQGIIPRVITGMYDLLREAKEERPNVSYTVRCQFLEIYGEDIHDLLEPAGSTVTIREGQNGEVNVHGAKEMLVNGAEVRERKKPRAVWLVVAAADLPACEPFGFWVLLSVGPDGGWGELRWVLAQRRGKVRRFLGSASEEGAVSGVRWPVFVDDSAEPFFSLGIQHTANLS